MLRHAVAHCRVPRRWTIKSLRQLVLEIISDRWSERNSDALPSISDDDNLFDMGVVDSMAMVEIIEAVQKSSGFEIDYLTFDPAAFYTLRGIAAFAEGSSEQGRRGASIDIV
jgi:acyl carrier protein